MSKKAKVIAGHLLNKHQHGAAISLIEMTTGRFGVHKQNIRTEDQLWHGIAYISGLKPKEDESFIEAIYRIRGTIGAHTKDWRAAMIGLANRDRLLQIMGIVTSSVSTDQLIGRQPRQPRIPREKRPRTNIIVKSHRPSVANKEEFYASWEWCTLRLKAIKKFGRACQCCGAEPGDRNAAGERVKIHVDHIKPISKYWHLRLELSNLQVLCNECNKGKGNWDETDFRPDETPDEWAEPPFEDIALEGLASMAPANGRAA